MKENSQGRSVRQGGRNRVLPTGLVRPADCQDPNGFFWFEIPPRQQPIWTPEEFARAMEIVRRVGAQIERESAADRKAERQYGKKACDQVRRFMPGAPINPHTLRLARGIRKMHEEWDKKFQQELEQMYQEAGLKMPGTNEQHSATTTANRRTAETRYHASPAR